MNIPKISIIVPVYNAEKYLRQCLESISAQNYTTWECILVDDGSKDESGRICDEFASRDSRFISVHQDNNGVSSARNNGLAHANSEWILFVDSDDCLEKDYLLKYVEAINDEIDIVYGGYKPFGLSRVGMPGLKFQNCSYYNGKIDDAIPLLLSYCTPWGKLFRRSLIIEHNLKFEEKLCVSEDRLFLYQYFAYIRGVKFISYRGYNYRVTENSLMNKVHSIDVLNLRMKLIWNAALELKQKWKLSFLKFLPFYNVHCGYVTVLFRLTPFSKERHELYQFYVGDFFGEDYRKCTPKERNIIKSSLGNKKFYFSKNECCARVLLFGVRIKSALRSFK